MVAFSYLLSAAMENLEVLAQVVNKYGRIEMPHKDTIGTLAQETRMRLYKEAKQTILDSRRQELISHIDELINMVMGVNSMPVMNRHKERLLSGTLPGEPNGTSNIASQRHGIHRSHKTSVDPSLLVKGLAMLTILERIINQQRKKQTRDE